MDAVIPLFGNIDLAIASHCHPDWFRKMLLIITAHQAVGALLLAAAALLAAKLLDVPVETARTVTPPPLPKVANKLRVLLAPELCGQARLRLRGAPEALAGHELRCAGARGTTGAMSETGPRMKLADGRSEVVSCSEDARTLVLLRNGAEVRSMPIRLRADEVVVFEL